MRYVLLGMLALAQGTVVVVLSRSQAMLREFWLFLKAEKKWWLTPIVLVLLLVMALMLAQVSAPYLAFLYPIH